MKFIYENGRMVLTQESKEIQKRKVRKTLLISGTSAFLTMIVFFSFELITDGFLPFKLDFYEILDLFGLGEFFNHPFYSPIEKI